MSLTEKDRNQLIIYADPFYKVVVVTKPTNKKDLYILELEKHLIKQADCIDFYADQWTTWEGANGRTIIPQDSNITEENRPSGGKRASLFQTYTNELITELRSKHAEYA